MNQQQIFDFHGNQVRTIEKDDQPWFVLTDVCKALEIGNSSDVKKRLEEGVVSIEVLRTAGGKSEGNKP